MACSRLNRSSNCVKRASDRRLSAHGSAPEVVAGAADRVYPSAEAVEPLAPGSSVPSVTVSTVGKATVDLSEVVRDQGALLVFYRGGW